MIKIQHPGAIVRDREKQVNNWEGVRLYKYSNGVECQILIGQLPHGHLQSAISANRAFTLEKTGSDVTVVFKNDAAELVDFLSGARLTAETENTVILDACHFIPSTKVSIQHGGESAELAPEGANLVASFKDGTKVTVEPHGGHGHVEANLNGQPVKTFLNGQDNKLYVFGAVEA